jgi:hypothetical protein
MIRKILVHTQDASSSVAGPQGADQQLATIRDCIPMDYLEEHRGDLVGAIRAYSEARWRIIERCKKAEALVPDLVKALRELLQASETDPRDLELGGIEYEAILDDAQQRARAAIAKATGGDA